MKIGKLVESIRMGLRIHREIGVGHVGAIMLELADAAIAFSISNPQRCVNPFHCQSTRCRLVNAAHGFRGLVATYAPDVIVAVADRYPSTDADGAATPHPEHGAN